MEIDTFLADRIRELRRARGFTLDQLAQHSGVSRSMISLIERRETSPTAAVLDRLAAAFGLSLPAFFAAAVPQAEPDPVSRHTQQPVWTDPASGYVRRHLSPTGTVSPIELVEVSFPAGETVVFERPAGQARPSHQIWLLEGEMDIALEHGTWRLQRGDCMAMQPGPRITFHNPGSQPARYLLALALAPLPA